MKPEKQYLIHDLLDNQREARREATLLAGGRILRRRRFRRATTRVLAAVTLLGIAGLSLQRMNKPASSATTTFRELSAQNHGLTDEELLALFPGTPVGLVTLESGRKLLVFPRPGDEARFVSRL